MDVERETTMSDEEIRKRDIEILPLIKRDAFVC